MMSNYAVLVGGSQRFVEAGQECELDSDDNKRDV